MNQLYSAPLQSADHDSIRAAATPAPQIGIIIPACDEEPCLGRVLEELLAALDPDKYAVAVGVNGSSDRTVNVAKRYLVIVTETETRGYGFGCTKAIEALRAAHPSIRAYVFFAADGASDPRDVAALVGAYEQGYPLVLGARTTSLRNWPAMTFPHVLANFSLALWCGFLSRRWFTDLAPHRLVARELFETIAPQEMTYGWTIEAQIAAAMLGVEICEIPAHERERIAGEQKVSGVTWRRTLLIGCRIVAAGWRTHARWQEKLRHATAPPRVTVPAPRLG